MARPGSALLRGLLGRPRTTGGGGTPPEEITGAVAASLPGLQALALAPGAPITGTVAAALPGLAAAASDGSMVRSQLAANLPPQAYWEPFVPFLDLGMQREDWGYGGGGSIPLDSMGWPTQVVAGSGQYAGWQATIAEPGQFVALYQGTGTLSVDFGGSIVSSVNGRYVLQLNGSTDPGLEGRVAILITSSSSSDPVRNLVVVPIAYEHNHATQIFHPRVLELLRPFSALRFMDWQRINNIDRLNPWPDPTPDLSRAVTAWASRTPHGHALQARRQGIALEYAIDLCNRNNSDLHFSVPMFATTDWCNGAAPMIAGRLNSNLHVWFEYGNEIWNDAFWNGTDAHALGVAAGLPNEEHDTRYYYQAMMGRYMKERLEEVMAPSRVHHVLGSQMWDNKITALCDRRFQHGLFTDGSFAYEHADQLHLAPYIGGELPITGSETVAQVLTDMHEELTSIASLLTTFKSMANTRGLGLGVYECGQHLYNGDFENTGIQNLLTAVNQDTGMYQLMYDYLDMMVSVGVNGPIHIYTLCQTYSAFGRWGWMESMWNQIGATPRQCPKMDAAVQWNLDNGS